MNLQRNTTATLLEKRLAICMTCGRVGSWKGRPTFEELAVMFEGSTAEIVRLADWDTVKTNKFAIRAIAYLLNCENEKLPKEMMVAFDENAFSRPFLNKLKRNISGIRTFLKFDFKITSILITL